ncbi:MAG: NUDIX hydrolase [Granulosicoccaceae bacterium]|jgi:ADP-ribose pyrophosphatase YjhB (NUDIX family)
MNWAPHVTVAAIIEQDARYLIVEENDAGQRVYNQPAGHLEQDESLLEAVIREVFEETARRFTPDKLVGIYQWKKPGTDMSFLRVCFSGQAGPQREEQALDADIIATHWMTVDELAANPAALRSPMVLQCIADYRQGQQYPLDILQAV